jgi:L-phenylalanine/L-methionine N-acetyltransferase
MHRNATQNDLQFIYDLYMHPQVNPHLLYEMMDLEEFKPIYEDLLKDEIKYIFMDDAGTPVGMFKLSPLKHRCNHIFYLGGLAVHPDFTGKGLGVKMMQEIMDLAQKNGCKRLELSAGTENLRAIELYKKVGFEAEGVMRKYTYLKREGRFLDELLMSYIFE